RQLSGAAGLYLGVYPAEAAREYDGFVSALAKQAALPLAAVEDVRYLNPGDQFLCQVLRAVKERRTFSESELAMMAQGQGSHWLRPATAVEAACREMGLSEALENSWKIAEKCSAEIPFAKPQVPVFPQDSGLSSAEYLEKLAYAGLKQRVGRQPAYEARLKKELAVINEMGFADYFLIVGDIVAYCRGRGALVGPGRGSAAGSLVAYALGITQIDPLKYDLLFERFLNPARANMPDIDLDFTSSGRDLAFAYVREKYGRQQEFGQGSDLVARILALTSMKAKSVLDRVGQVFKLTLPTISRLKKAMGNAKSLKEAYQQPEFRSLIDASSLTQLLYQTARRLEGLPEDTGTHAPGLVISQQPLSAKIGLLSGKEAPLWTVEQTKKYVESYGLLKIDFLTLDNLELLEHVLGEIKKNGSELQLGRLPLDDPETLQLFARGETQQIFQFNSSGMQKVLQQLQPRNFDDLAVAVALYRPGPIASIPLYVARKNGIAPVSYPDPSLQGVLGPTYGIFVYQEQVMQTAQIFAGFSLAEADVFRNAISKKEAAVLAREKGKFIAGAVKQGHSKQTAEAVYALIEPFANYGFNHSHAVAYALLAYWQAFLAVHFPREFYLEKIRSSRAKEKGAVIQQARRAGVEVFGPDINLSQGEARLFEGRIYLGLKDIYGVSQTFLDRLLALKRPITSFSAFLRQLDPEDLKERQIVPLIEAGAFDQISSNRNSLLVNCDNLIKNARLTQKSLLLQDLLAVKETAAPQPTAAEKIAMEEKALGFAVTTSPLELASKILAKRYGAKSFAAFGLGESGTVIAQFSRKNDWRVKRGRHAGELGSNAVFTDGSSSEKVTVFTDQYR
ncbi:DNA polymerase III subunit alpha, partial [Lactobacillus nasalidis]